MSQTDSGVQIIYKKHLSSDTNSTHLPYINKHNSYSFNVSLMNKNKYVSAGYLYKITDTAVYVYEPPPPVNIYNYIERSQYNLPYKIVYIEVNKIKKISYRRNNNIGIGVGIGAVTGLLIGGTFGYLQGDDVCNGFCILNFSAQGKIYIYGIPSMLVGVAIGAMIGSNYTTLKIDGKKSIYDKYKKELSDFAITK